MTAATADSGDSLIDSFYSKVKSVIDDTATVKVRKKNGRQKAPLEKLKNSTKYEKTADKVAVRGNLTPLISIGARATDARGCSRDTLSLRALDCVDRDHRIVRRRLFSLSQSLRDLAIKSIIKLTTFTLYMQSVASNIWVQVY